MALPLLLGLGMGILGGSQYLMKKADNREASRMLDQFMPQIPGLMGSQWNAQFEQAANDLRVADDGFLSANKTEQAKSLLDRYDQTMQATMQAQQAAQQQHWARSIDRADQLDQDYNRDLKVFGGVVQPAYQQAMAALENPNSADSVAALYNFFNIMEPGGRVTENEDGSFSGIGGAGAKLANWFNKMRGEGLDSATVEQIKSAINNQYRSQYTRAQKQKAYYERQMRNYNEAGYDVQSPVGSLGIDWNQDVSAMQPGYRPEAPPSDVPGSLGRTAPGVLPPGLTRGPG